MKNEVIKIVIMDWDTLVETTIDDIKKKRAAGGNGVIYVKNIDVARKILTPQRMRLLSTVRKSKPVSLYALAKMMKKDIKSVISDANMLNHFGLLKLDSYIEGKQKKVRPQIEANRIQMELAV